MRGLPRSSGSAELADSASRTRCGLAALRALTTLVLNAAGTSTIQAGFERHLATSRYRPGLAQSSADTAIYCAPECDDEFGGEHLRAESRWACMTARVRLPTAEIAKCEALRIAKRLGGSMGAGTNESDTPPEEFAAWLFPLLDERRSWRAGVEHAKPRFDSGADGRNVQLQFGAFAG
jgi:hypothetical protein